MFFRHDLYFLNHCHPFCTRGRVQFDGPGLESPER
jgi:hypothetical protein